MPHKLDPYTGIIDSRLEEFPKLSAKRLFDEVRAAGYPGGYSRVRDYVRAVRPRQPVESVVRFETPAGRQGQVDFGTFTLPWGRRHALVVVLSHSRLLWLCFFRRQTMAVLIEGLESAFARFGGVPNELLFDQMRAVVLSDERAGGGELKRFSDSPCTAWARRGTSACTNAGGPMQAYSMDLRERALLDSDAGMKAADVAVKYRVSGSWVRLLKQRRRETGEVAPRVQRHGRRRMLEPHLHTLAALIAEQPDRTLAELKDALGTPASLATIWRAVAALDVTVKKNGPALRTRST